MADDVFRTKVVFEAEKSQLEAALGLLNKVSGFKAIQVQLNVGGFSQLENLTKTLDKFAQLKIGFDPSSFAQVQSQLRSVQDEAIRAQEALAKAQQASASELNKTYNVAIQKIKEYKDLLAQNQERQVQAEAEYAQAIQVGNKNLIERKSLNLEIARSEVEFAENKLKENRLIREGTIEQRQMTELMSEQLEIAKELARVQAAYGSRNTNTERSREQIRAENRSATDRSAINSRVQDLEAQIAYHKQQAASARQRINPTYVNEYGVDTGERVTGGIPTVFDAKLKQSGAYRALVELEKQAAKLEETIGKNTPEYKEKAQEIAAAAKALNNASTALQKLELSNFTKSAEDLNGVAQNMHAVFGKLAEQARTLSFVQKYTQRNEIANTPENLAVGKFFEDRNSANNQASKEALLKSRVGQRLGLDKFGKAGIDPFDRDRALPGLESTESLKHQLDLERGILKQAATRFAYLFKSGLLNPEDARAAAELVEDLGTIVKETGATLKQFERLDSAAKIVAERARTSATEQTREILAQEAKLKKFAESTAVINPSDYAGLVSARERAAAQQKALNSFQNAISQAPDSSEQKPLLLRLEQQTKEKLEQQNKIIGEYIDRVTANFEQAMEKADARYLRSQTAQKDNARLGLGFLGENPNGVVSQEKFEQAARIGEAFAPISANRQLEAEEKRLNGLLQTTDRSNLAFTSPLVIDQSIRSKQTAIAELATKVEETSKLPDSKPALAKLAAQIEQFNKAIQVEEENRILRMEEIAKRIAQDNNSEALRPQLLGIAEGRQKAEFDAGMKFLQGQGINIQQLGPVDFDAPTFKSVQKIGVDRLDRIAAARASGRRALFDTTNIQTTDEFEKRIRLAKSARDRARIAIDDAAQTFDPTAIDNAFEDFIQLATGLKGLSAKFKEFGASGKKGIQTNSEPADVRFAKARRALLFASPEEREDLPGFRDTVIKRFSLDQKQASELKLPGFFEPGRLANPETAVQLGFATAFGGLPSILGALIGGATPLGPSGALLGSTIAQGAGGLLFDKPIELLKEVVNQFKEAGVAFERSILGITAIRQANFDTILPPALAGTPEGRSRAIDAQQQSARQIQLEARKRLLPLGIGGETEATFVQGIVSALSQRGVDASSRQTGHIAELIGGAISAERPSLLDNTQQLLKDLQDVIGGGPNAQRTILGQILKPVLPSLQRATTAEEIEKALAPLSAFVDVAKGANNPIVVQNRLKGAVENLNVAGGEAFLQRITPSLQKLFVALSSDKALAAAEKLGDILGTLFSKIIDIQAALVPVATELIDHFTPALRELPHILKDATVALIALGVASKTSFGKKAVDIATEAGGDLLGFLFGKKIAQATSTTSSPSLLLNSQGLPLASPGSSGAVTKLPGFFEKFGTKLGTTLGKVPFLGAAGIGLSIGSLVAGGIELAALDRENEADKFEEAARIKEKLAQNSGTFAVRQKSIEGLQSDLQKIGLKEEFDKAESARSTSPEIQIKGIEDFLTKGEGLPAGDDLAREFFLERSSQAGLKKAELLKQLKTEDINSEVNTSTVGGRVAASFARVGLTQELEPGLKKAVDDAQARLDLITHPSDKYIQEQKQRQQPTIQTLQEESDKAQKALEANAALLAPKAKPTLLDALGKSITGVLSPSQAIVGALDESKSAGDLEIARAKAAEEKDALKKKADAAKKAADDAKAEFDKIGTEDSKEAQAARTGLRDARLKFLANQQEYINELGGTIQNLRAQLAAHVGVIDQGSGFGQKLAGLAGRGEAARELTLAQYQLKNAKSIGEREEAQLNIAGAVRNDFDQQALIRKGEVSLISEQGAGLDQNTFRGRTRLLDVQRRALAKDVELLPNEIQSLRTQFLAETSKPRGEQNDDLVNSLASKQRAAEVELETKKGQLRDKQREEFLTDPVSRIKGRLDVEKSQKELEQVSSKLAERFEQLGEAATSAARSLEDYQHQERLRSLGRQGERLAAAEAVLKAGGSEYDLPVDLQFASQPENRQRFDLEFAKEKLSDVERRNAPDRVAEEESAGLHSRERAKAEADRALENYPLESKETQLNAAFNVLQNVDKFKDVPVLAAKFAPIAKQALDKVKGQFGAESPEETKALEDYFKIDSEGNPVSALDSVLGGATPESIDKKQAASAKAAGKSTASAEASEKKDDPVKVLKDIEKNTKNISQNFDLKMSNVSKSIAKDLSEEIKRSFI